MMSSLLKSNTHTISTLCSICLKDNEDLQSLYDTNIPKTNETVANFIAKLTSLELAKEDKFPTTICIECINSLSEIHMFINMCLDSYRKLKLILSNAEKVEYLEVNTDSGISITNTTHNVENDANSFLLAISENDESNEEIPNLEACIIENEKNEHTCLHCEKRFADEQNLQTHLKTHKKVLECEICTKNFEKVKQLKNHMKIHTKLETKHFQCDICDQKFTYEYLLRQHSYKHTDKKPFPCTVCDKGCTTKESLRRHMVIHKEDYVKRKHKCEICNKEFPYPSFLAEHMKNHTGEKPYLCSICGKGFRQSGALAYHLRSHSGTKPFKCELCDNYFMSTGTLRVHMRRHTNERPYVCDICGMAFRQSTDMKSHRRNHLGEKRVLCFICGKGLATTGQLTVHMRSHTGEKPYKCSTCSKAFSTRTMLVKHIRIHTGERPYACTICNKTFTQRSTLKTHYNTHKQNLAKDGQPKIVIDGFIDTDCIIVNQEQGTHYSINTEVRSDLNSSKTEFNVVVLPAPVPLISSL